MTNSQPTKSRFKSWINNLQETRRIVVLDEGSFEEKRNFTTSKFSIIVIILFSIIVFGTLFFFLISATSLKTFISGYPNPTLQKELIDKNIKLDQKLSDLIDKTSKEEQYLNNIQKILNGGIPNNRDTVFKVFKSQKINNNQKKFL